jgi:hypothetical protein
MPVSRALLSAACLFLAGCATSSGVNDVQASASAAAATDPGTAVQTVANVQEVDMRTVTDDTVCRSEKPTGSQIAITRCRSTNTPEDETSRYLLQREFEEMRNRQAYEEQARRTRDAAIRSGAGRF